MSRFNRVWAVGRRSDKAYIRFYPNPGFMFPWFGGRRIVWSQFDGWLYEVSR
jgi:hypothetical protein